MDKALERAIGNEVLNFDKMADNYLDVYPLIIAVLQRETASCLEPTTSRAQNRQATEYRGDYRIWNSYAGDYTDK